MSQKKSPFKGFTINEVFAAESTSYVIQVGVDLFCHKGRFCFDKRNAALFYNRILSNLVDLITNGDEDQKKEALRCLGSLRISPLRIN